MFNHHEMQLNEHREEFLWKRDELVRRFEWEIQRSRDIVDQSDLIKRKEETLWTFDDDEPRSRYDLLRQQTKGFYSLFRTILLEQSEKELRQLDDQQRKDFVSLDNDRHRQLRDNFHLKQQTERKELILAQVSLLQR